MSGQAPPPELPDGPPEHPPGPAADAVAGGEGESTEGGTPAEAAKATGLAGRRGLIIGAAVALVVLVVVVVVLLARPGDPTYDEASRQRFLDACTADGGEPVRSTCECLYDAIVADVPYDRFETISGELSRDAADLAPGEPLELPEDIQAKLDACR